MRGRVLIGYGSRGGGEQGRGLWRAGRERRTVGARTGMRGVRGRVVCGFAELEVSAGPWPWPCFGRWGMPLMKMLILDNHTYTGNSGPISFFQSHG